MQILAIYKELRDVVILKDSEGKIHIRSQYIEEGTEEEREVIRQTVGGDGFKPSLIQQVGRREDKPIEEPK